MEQDEFPQSYQEAAELLFGNEAQTFPDLYCTENISYDSISLRVNLNDLVSELAHSYSCDASTKVRFIKKLFNSCDQIVKDDMLPDLLTFFLYLYMNDKKAQEEHSINQALGKYIKLKGMARPHNSARVDQLVEIIRDAVEELTTFAQGEINKCGSGR